MDGAIKHAQWWEDCIRAVSEEDCDKICVCGLCKDGSVLTAYTHCDLNHKAMFAGAINRNVIMDTVLANIDTVKESLEGLE